MKKLIYLAILAFIPSSFLLAHHGERAIEGYWYSPSSNKEIKIETKKYGLKVKGLSSERKFRPVGHKTYSNFEGTKIKFEERGVIKVTTKRRRGWNERTKVTVRRFYKDGVSKGQRGDGRSYEGNYNHDDRGGYGSNDYRDVRQSKKSNWLSPSGTRAVLAGEWKTIGLDPNVGIVITTSTTGIKAKFRKSDKWVFYAQSGDDPRVFKDRRGNKYVLTGSNTMQWYGFDGKEFNLVKRD